MPNIFELLGLDPDLPWEPEGREQYENNLRAKRSIWANQRNAPGKISTDATRYFNMARGGVFDEIMKDVAARNAQAEERRQTLANKRNGLWDALVKWKREAPTVTQAQINTWSHDFEVAITDVEQMVKKADLAVVAATSPSPAQRINPITLKNVRDHLDALRHLDSDHVSMYDDLYTFLEKSRDDSSDLSSVATKMSETLKNNMNKTDTLTHKIELAGLAGNIFKTAASRKQYDEMQRMEPLERLLDEMEMATGGAAPREGHVETYFQGARKAGFGDEDIRSELGYRALQRKWGIIETPRRPAQRPCPFCAELVALDDNSCPVCGQMLKLDCPNCGATGIAIERAACPKCGFLTGQRAWVAALVDDAREAIGGRQFNTATALVAEARRLWAPANADAIARSIAEVNGQIRQHDRQQLAEQIQRQLNAASQVIIQADYTTARGLIDDAKMRWRPDDPDQDALTARMRELDDKLAPYESEIQARKQMEAEQEQRRQEVVAQSVRQIEASIGLRDLIAARTRLESLAPADRAQVEVAAVAQTLQQELDKAEDQLRLARNASSAEECIRLCHAALDICADHPAALDLLKASRPPRPGNVRLQVYEAASHATVQLAWRACSEQRVTYCVTRKVGSAPVTEMDGAVILHDTTDLAFVDQRPPAGVELYYAVFTRRARVGVYSAPAVAREPVVLADEVRKVQAEARDGAIKLTWKPPAHAQILIVRKEGVPPRSHEDGAPVRALDAGSALDKGLANGTVYYYGIYCRYARGVVSTGVTTHATPHARPDIPPPLTTTGQLNSVGWCEVDVRWGDDSRQSHRDLGRKVVYRVDPTPLFHRGAELSERDAQPYIWQTIEMRNGHGEDRLSQPGLAFYVPAVIVEGSIYSGEPQPFRFIPDLEQVEAQSVVGAIRVTWNWPPHVTDAIIAPGTQLEPEYTSEAALRRTGALLISRSGQHDTRGHYDFPAQAQRRVRLMIAPAIRTDGHLVAGTAAPLQGEAAEMADIAYEFIRPREGLLRRSTQHTLLLRVRNRGPLTTLPALVVRIKEGAEPSGYLDGDEWWKFAEQPLPIGEVRLSLPGLPRRPGGDSLYGAVFFSDDAHTRTVRLASAGAGKTRLM